MAAISGPNIPLDGLVFNMDPASNLSYPARNDPYRDQISLLLDGTTLTDKSRNSFTITVNGNTQIVSDSTFGNAVSFDGSGDWLSISPNAAFDFGANDFTFEAWVYFNSSSLYQSIFNLAYDGAGGLFFGKINSAFALYGINGGSVITSGGTVGLNTWQFVTVTRQSGLFKIWVDGVQVASATNATAINLNNPITVGGGYAGTYPFNGRIGWLRVIKGVALPSSSFTFPYKFNFLPSTIKDIKNDIVGTFTNGPIFSNTQKGMISFYNNNWIDTGTNFSNITSDISISLWMKYKGTQSYNASVLANHASSPNRGFCIEQYNSNAGQYIFAFGNGTTFYGGSTVFNITEDVWTHVVCIKSGTTIYNYVNGELKSTTSCGSTIAINASKNIMVGGNGWSGTRYWNGNIGNLKIYNKAISSSEIKQIYNAEREKYVEIPKTISGLQLWLDAADLSTLRQNSNGTTAVAANSDPIGYWADKSGNGRNVLQATSSYRPVFAAGVKGLFPGVTFDGVDDFLESTASGATSIVDSTLIMVARWNDVSGTDTPVIIGRGYTGGGEVRAFYRPSGTTKFSWGTWNGDLGTTTIDVGQNTFNIFAATQAGNQIRLYKNYSYNSYTYGNTPASPTYNQWDIGGPNNGYDQYAGITIGEVLVFNRSLEHSEMLTLLAYLNGKWGVV